MALSVKTQTSPAAATDFTMVVPANKWWRLYSAHAKLVSDGNATVRAVNLIIDDGTNNLWTMSDPGQAASITVNWNLVPGATLPANAATSAISRIFPVMACVLGPGYRFRSSTPTGLQGADQWSEINMLVEEFNTDPTLLVRGGMVL